MRVATGAPLAICDAVLEGCGTAHFGAAARAIAAGLEEDFAALAEALGCEFSAHASAHLLSIRALSSDLAAAARLLQHALCGAKAPSEQVLARIEAEIAMEQSDYDLRSARGFLRNLLTLRSAEELSDADVAGICERFKSCELNFCISCEISSAELASLAEEFCVADAAGGEAANAAGDLRHIYKDNARANKFINLTINKNSKNYEKFLKDCEEITQILAQPPGGQMAVTSKISALKLLLHLERPGLCAHPARAAGGFDIFEPAPASQVFMHFGHFIGELNLEQKAAAAIVSAAFGGGFCSRLTELIRVQSGLAYSAYARINYARSNAYWLGFLQTAAANFARAKAMVAKQFAALQNGLSEEEFSSAKNYLLSSYVLKNATVFSVHKNALGAMQQAFEADFSERLIEAVRACTLAGANEFCARFCGELSFYTIGPAAADIPAQNLSQPPGGETAVTGKKSSAAAAAAQNFPHEGAHDQ